MLTWLIAALILHAVHVLTPTGLFLPAEGLTRHLGGRDEVPEASVLVERARRALANWQESLPVFIALALADLHFGTGPLAVTGAAVFVLARLAYLPLYLAAVPGLRTLVWAVAVAGLVMMGVALA